MKIKNSPNNELFNQYQSYVNVVGEQMNNIHGRINLNKGNKDSTKILNKMLEEKNHELNEYRLDVINKHPESVLAMVFTIMREPNVPEKPKNSTDSFFGYHYYKAHYWDDMMWGDHRILRTPIFHQKLKDYFGSYTVPDPDSINASCDFVLKHAMADSEVFKYTLTYLTHEYETSKIMGYDSVFCHLARVYYIQKREPWVDSAAFAKLYDRWWKEDKGLLGRYAHELNLEDTNGAYHSLYSIISKYTLVAFWDSQCSHCQHDIPRLDSFYRTVFKTRGIDVYAIDIEAKKGRGTWKKFIKDHKLTWTNVWDPDNQSSFRQYYDIYSTPVFYLLDKNKHILAKRIDIDQVMEIINHIEKVDQKKTTPANGSK
jgi:thiol-disulfide isomerase/thioredoxin